MSGCREAVNSGCPGPGPWSVQILQLHCLPELELRRRGSSGIRGAPLKMIYKRKDVLRLGGLMVCWGAGRCAP